jgi:PIN domain nuclease of toxin-antitoxin system
MGYLLDTHTFLWWITADRRLSRTVRELIEHDENDIFFSAASGWEIATKAALGRLRLDSDPSTFVPTELETNGFRSLPIEVRHVLHVYALPRLHRDPFDRILIVQSQLENLPLLTVDSQIHQYQVTVIW